MSAEDGELHAFFRDSLEPSPMNSYSQRPGGTVNRRASDPVHHPWFSMFSSMNQSRSSVPRLSRGVTRPLINYRRQRTSLSVRLRDHECLTDPEEETPPSSPRSTRSPSPTLKEYNPIARPNTPTGGIPKSWERRAEDSINMGFGFALSWMDTLKASRHDAEERIRLPRIYPGTHWRTLIMMVAVQNVDETLFHKVEVERKSEKRMRVALAEHFNLTAPSRRLRYRVSSAAYVPLTQVMIERFEAEEYFRLDVSRTDTWILNHIVNSSTSSCRRRTHRF